MPGCFEDAFRWVWASTEYSKTFEWNYYKKRIKEHKPEVSGSTLGVNYMKTVRKEIEYKCLHTVNCSNRLLCLLRWRSCFWIFLFFLWGGMVRDGEWVSRTGEWDGRERKETAAWTCFSYLTVGMQGIAKNRSIDYSINTVTRLEHGETGFHGAQQLLWYNGDWAIRVRVKW